MMSVASRRSSSSQNFQHHRISSSSSKPLLKFRFRFRFNNEEMTRNCSISYRIGFWFLLLTYHFEFISSFKINSRTRNANVKLFESASATRGSVESKVKLPIVQVYHDKEILSEFICGSDIDLSIQKLKSFLSIVSKEVVGDFKYNGIKNMYSDNQLTDFIETHEKPYLVIMLSRLGCKKCAKLEPIIDGFAINPQYFMFDWAVADVENIEKYVGDLKTRLLGKTTAIEDCSVCSNTGFVRCVECGGAGMVQKGDLTVTCPTCVGYKATRCPNCGGKCSACTTE